MNWTKEQREQRIDNLLEHGTGASANAIMRKELGKDKDEFADYPYDFGDLMRCMNVVNIFRIDIDIMKGSNWAWDEIINNWDALCDFCWDKNEKGANELLEKIISEKTQVRKSELNNSSRPDAETCCMCGEPIDHSNPDCVEFRLCSDHQDEA